MRLPHAREAALSHWSLPGPWVGHPPPPAGTKQWPEACLFPTPPPVRNARRAPTCGWAHPRSIRVAAPAGFDTARGGSADGGGVIPTSPPKPGDHEVAHNFLFERRNATAHWKNTRSNAHIRAGSLSAGRPAPCPIGRWLGAEIPTMASQGNLVGYVGHRAHAGRLLTPAEGSQPTQRAVNGASRCPYGPAQAEGDRNVAARRPAGGRPPLIGPARARANPATACVKHSSGVVRGARSPPLQRGPRWTCRPLLGPAMATTTRRCAESCALWGGPAQARGLFPHVVVFSVLSSATVPVARLRRAPLRQKGGAWPGLGRGARRQAF